MPQSLSNILVHLVFSTKNRESYIQNKDRDALHAYIGGIIENLNGILLKAGSVEDHIHLLIVHPRTCSPADLVKEIKTGTSKWIKDQSVTYANFHWQSGYGIFSISPGHKSAIDKYIDNQAEHHKQLSFQDEFRRLLQKYNIQWNEQYVWD